MCKSRSRRWGGEWYPSQ